VRSACELNSTIDDTLGTIPSLIAPRRAGKGHRQPVTVPPSPTLTAPNRVDVDSYSGRILARAVRKWSVSIDEHLAERVESTSAVLD
jgi:hypothetical protein